MDDLEKLSGYVPVQYIVWTILVLLAVVVILYKCYPKIKIWFETARKAENKREDIDELLERHNKKLEELKKEIQKINTKLSNDHTEISKIEEITVKQQQYIEDSMEERELIIRSLLGVVQGLQEVGANGPTKKTEKEIQDYLVRKTHKNPDGINL